MPRKNKSCIEGRSNEMLNRIYAVYCACMDEQNYKDMNIVQISKRAGVSRNFFYTAIGSIANLPNVALNFLMKYCDECLTNVQPQHAVSVIKTLFNAAKRLKYAAHIVITNAETWGSFCLYLSAVLEKYVYGNGAAKTGAFADIITMNNLFLFHEFNRIMEDEYSNTCEYDASTEAARIVSAMRFKRPA